MEINPTVCKYKKSLHSMYLYIYDDIPMFNTCFFVEPSSSEQY